MIHQFTKENIETIGKVLGASPKPLGADVYRIEVVNTEENARLALEIHLGLEANGTEMNFISVYSGNTTIQLHNCTAFAASEINEQVIFFGKSIDRTSGLIVDKASSCSLYANVDEAIISGDFTSLPEDLMMCAIALSLTELMDDDFSF